MLNIKPFKSFINESSVIDLISEGRYDSIVGEIVRDTANLIRISNNGKEKFGNVKVRYTAKEAVPSFDELIYDEVFLPVGQYATAKSGIEIDVNLVIVRDEAPEYAEQYQVSGDADIDDSTIYLEISINPEFEPGCYSSIIPELRDVVRHEIEHLTQRGDYEKPGKFMKDNQVMRQRINSDPNLRYKYYKLKDEVDANLQGLYAKAKTLKRPFHEVVMGYLDRQTSRGIIPENKKMEIYNIWKDRASTIKGLPPL